MVVYVCAMLWLICVRRVCVCVWWWQAAALKALVGLVGRLHEREGSVRPGSSLRVTVRGRLVRSARGNEG